MPFPWMHSSVPQRAPSTRRVDMYRRELEDRARLMLRLRFSKEKTKARLVATTAWDFELHGRPRHAAEIDRIVEEVYRRGGSGTSV